MGFKVGDRVRLTDSENGDISPGWVGLTATVTEVSEYATSVRLDPEHKRPDGATSRSFIWVHGLELISPEPDFDAMPTIKFLYRALEEGRIGRDQFSIAIRALVNAAP